MQMQYKSLIVMTIFAMVMLVGAAWWGYSQIETNRRAEMHTSLETVLETSHEATRVWVRQELASVQTWAESGDVIRLTEELLNVPPDQTSLIAAPVTRVLRNLLSSVQAARRYEGFFIIGPNNISLSSSRDSNVGSTNLLVNHPRVLDRLWRGESVLSLPMRSDVPLPDSHGVKQTGRATMFVGSPIRGAAGNVIALLTFRLNPSMDFTSIFRRGRLGSSGETYAFNSQGQLISESRFDDQLRHIGLIGPEERAILNVELRDPGENLVTGEIRVESESTLRLTRMAASAIAGNTDFDVHGYRDYRGVPVVGAWLWDANLGLGITTELDVKEAYKTLYATGLIIVLMTMLAMLLLIGLAGMFAESRRKALHLEQALTKVLDDFIPTCEGCKKIRSEDGEWNEIETYVSQKTQPQFSHSICPNCGRELYGDLYDEVKEKLGRSS